MQIGDYNDGQRLFVLITKCFLFIARYLVKALIYMPFLLTGYMIASYFESIKADPLYRILLALIFTKIIYILFKITKNIMLTQSRGKKNLKMVLFVTLTFFCCILPSIILFVPINKLFGSLPNIRDKANFLSFLLCTGFGLFLLEYHGLLPLKN